MPARVLARIPLREFQAQTADRLRVLLFRPAKVLLGQVEESNDRKGFPHRKIIPNLNTSFLIGIFGHL